MEPILRTCDFLAAVFNFWLGLLAYLVICGIVSAWTNMPFGLALILLPILAFGAALVGSLLVSGTVCLIRVIRPVRPAASR